MGRWWGWPRYRVRRLGRRIHNMSGFLGKTGAVEPTHFGHAIRLGRDVSVYNLVRVMNVLEGAGLEVWDEEFGDTYVDIDYCRCLIEVDRELTYEEGKHRTAHTTDVSTVSVIPDTRSQVEVLHLFPSLHKSAKHPNQTMSMSKGGSPSREEMRMICSSSFLPRNKGSPVQISY